MGKGALLCREEAWSDCEKRAEVVAEVTSEKVNPGV